MVVLVPIIVAGGITSVAVVSGGALTGGPALALHTYAVPHGKIEPLDEYIRQNKVHSRNYTIPYSYEGRTYDVCYRIFEHQRLTTMQLQEVRNLTRTWVKISRQRSRQRVTNDSLRWLYAQALWDII